MCGIAGYAGMPRQHADVEAMCDAIVHRGPDDWGVYRGDGVALGMRRLSIIDVGGGHQPIGNEDGSVQVVFNGEIYNYRELQERLRKSGHRLSTNSDTETLVHLYEEHGADLVTFLRGMFAFAIWDDRAGQLLLARDRLGVKPLFYWETDSGVAFASELKSLLRLPDCPREIDPEAVAQYLALGYVPDPASVFRGVRKLEPGHVLIWQRGGGSRLHQYWTPFRPEDTSLREEDAVLEIRRLLTESVRYRLVADVPVGAFLSGGLDSSAVVAEMTQQMSRPVQTFSIGFAEPDFNEAPDAARVAKALGTDHTELIVRPDVEDIFEQVIEAFDEPFADSSAVPTFLVSQLASQQVKVVLTGDGGDETFGGYSRYLDLSQRSRELPHWLRVLIGSAARGLPQGLHGRNRLLEWSRTTEGKYAGLVAHPLDVAAGGVARASIAGPGQDLDVILDRWYRNVPGSHAVTRANLVDLISYLPGDILTKVDRMSMAVSLEARVPLLDHCLVEFAASLPHKLRWRGTEGKWIFRKAVSGMVPAPVLSKPKQGFGVPLRHWFRRDLHARISELLRPSASMYEYVEPEAVARVFREHRSGRRDHSAMIWKLLVLQTWMDSVARVAPSSTAPVQVAVAGRAW
jgi:asparagine synthase (glutamine-hydrolysing)